MKTIKRRAFCKAAAAAVAGVLAPHAAAEALLPQAAQAVVGSAVPEDYYSFAFRSDHSETDLSHDFYYTDAFFENTALQYSHKLALATLGLVAASGNTYQSDALYWVEGEAGREDSIADAYQKLGFANAVYAGYQCSLNTPVDTAGCAFAQKTLVQDGQRTTIIAAMLRGVGYGAEWASNLHVGEGGGHYGFVTAAEHFFEDLQDYLKKAEAAAGTLGTIKLWLGGYSRGAAVANLTAARIRQQLPRIAQENTFVYTFAAPAALTAADRPDLQADYDNNHTADGGLKTDWDVSNIFNIISSGDIVARVMPEEWGYHRNGNDRFLPSTAYQNELDDLSIIESRMGGVPLRFDQLATKEDVDSVIVAALAFCKSAANYHEKYEAAFMDMLQCAFTLSEKEAAEGVILDDEAVMERLRSMENIRKMSWTKVLRCDGFGHEQTHSGAGGGHRAAAGAAGGGAGAGGGSVPRGGERCAADAGVLHPQPDEREQPGRQRSACGILPLPGKLHHPDGILRPRRARHGSLYPKIKSPEIKKRGCCKIKMR